MRHHVQDWIERGSNIAIICVQQKLWLLVTSHVVEHGMHLQGGPLPLDATCEEGKEKEAEDGCLLCLVALFITLEDIRRFAL